MAAPTPPSHETIVEAMRLAAQGLGTREIGRRLGVSHTTVRDYLKKGRDQAAWIEIYDRAEQQGDMATRLVSTLAKAYAKAEGFEGDDDPTTWLAIQKFAADREAQLAVLLGLNAPNRLAIGDDRGIPAKPDEGLMRAVRKLRDRDEVDTRELRAGRPGVIEGGAQDG